MTEQKIKATKRPRQIQFSNHEKVRQMWGQNKGLVPRKPGANHQMIEVDRPQVIGGGHDGFFEYGPGNYVKSDKGNLYVVTAAGKIFRTGGEEETKRWRQFLVVRRATDSEIEEIEALKAVDAKEGRDTMSRMMSS